MDAVSASIAKREPAVLVGAIAALIQAGLVVAVAFGLKLTTDQITALAALAGVMIPVIQGVVTRGKVYSPATVDAVEKFSYEEGVANTLAEDAPEAEAYEPKRALVEAPEAE